MVYNGINEVDNMRLFYWKVAPDAEDDFVTVNGSDDLFVDILRDRFWSGNGAKEADHMIYAHEGREVAFFQGLASQGVIGAQEILRVLDEDGMIILRLE